MMLLKEWDERVEWRRVIGGVLFSTLRGDWLPLHQLELLEHFWYD